MMRSPAASSLAVIGPITFLATASGLMIENVRSMAMSDSLEAGSYPRGAAGSMPRQRSEHHVLRRAVQRHHAVGVELSEVEARDRREAVHGGHALGVDRGERPLLDPHARDE